MNQIRVLIVDDSAFMRKLIKDILEKDENIKVVGIARNGEECLKKISELKPDVVTLDVEMPKVNGLEALQEIMSSCPVPVIMLSSTTSKGADNTIAAMSMGAVDFLAKPSYQISLDLHEVEHELIEKVKIASLVNVNHLNFRHKKNSEPSVKKSKFGREDISGKRLLAIGTSTGGPHALQVVIENLPQVPCPIFVVQHMPRGFTKSLAERLNKLSSLHVKEAEHLEIAESGTVYIAPGGYHMTVVESGDSLLILLDETNPIMGHRPSVDRLFSSLALLNGYTKTAVILTGMGSDGTNGITEMRKRDKVFTIAESQETAVVYGMPKSIIKNNLADAIAPLDEISSIIHSMLTN